MLMRHLFIVVWGLLLLGGLSGPTIAGDEASGERILSFTSYIQVQPDASLTVTEAIVVRATGDQIKRGIVRDFPTVYKDRFGNRVTVGFKVLEARRDGAHEPYRVESAATGRKIYLGQKDIFLSPGVYTYTLKYRTTQQLGFFREFDELYWNVTGNAWTFPLDQVEAEVVLPPGATVKQYACYTGALGSKGQDFRASVHHGRMVFTSTRGFTQGEGMTIAVAWPKGFVQSPTRLTRIRYFLEDNPGAILAWLAVLAVLVYYLAVWFRVGRDPAKGLIIPLFEPPPGLSPAAVRLVKRMGFDDKAFAATLVQMAVKGWLIIEGHDGDFTLRRSGNQPSVPLTSLEVRILSKLFLGKDVLQMTASNQENIKSAENALKSNLEWEVEKKYFITNSGRLAWGVILSLLALVMAVLSAGDRDSMMIGGFLTLWLSIWTPVTIGLWVRAGKGQMIFAIPFTFFMVLAIIILFFFAPLVATVFVIVVCLNMLFYFLLRAYTVSGRRFMDQIEGFRMYLTAAEQERLELLHPPERTPELFEKYLPFALALDVENEWCEQFAEVLDQASYAPDWYQGSSWRSLGSGGLSTSLGSSLSASLSSSSSPPGSSSGSSGGGSSGGGSGGGGGSGW
jgi:uncharacterized membrane protein YgcG